MVFVGNDECVHGHHQAGYHNQQRQKQRKSSHDFHLTELHWHLHVIDDVLMRFPGLMEGEIKLPQQGRGWLKTSHHPLLCLLLHPFFITFPFTWINSPILNQILRQIFELVALEKRQNQVQKRPSVHHWEFTSRLRLCWLWLKLTHGSLRRCLSWRQSLPKCSTDSSHKRRPRNPWQNGQPEPTQI